MSSFCLENGNCLLGHVADVVEHVDSFETSTCAQRDDIQIKCYSYLNLTLFFWFIFYDLHVLEIALQLVFTSAAFHVDVNGIWFFSLMDVFTYLPFFFNGCFCLFATLISIFSNFLSRSA